MKYKILKNLLKVLGIYFIVAFLFMLIGGDHLRYKYVVSTMPQQTGAIEELNSDKVVKQKFTAKEETVDTIDLLVATYGRENSGLIQLTISDSQGKVVAEHKDDVSILEDNEIYKWVIEPGIENAKGKEYELTIKTTCAAGEAPTVYYSADASGVFSVDGQDRSGSICFDYVGRSFFMFGTYYWYFVIAGAALIVGYTFWCLARKKQGKTTLGLACLAVWERYEFLIKQLVARDFKTKYKRSVLGYLWSFLNPLLTMTVQYIVFSTIFRSGISNFPVYLLSGIILFNFFTDAVGQGLTSIVGNASLITKVYVPKYIYPVTRVVSCSINMLISVIPLLIVTLLTGAKITPAVLLLPFALACLLLFCIGMSLLLSTTEVFFRDTQYLWGIVSLVWMYATPLFYPENIIPAQFRFIQTLNPMYHYVRFVRTILINGCSPEPKAYLLCAASALLMCVFGAIVFKKNQDKFILYV